MLNIELGWRVRRREKEKYVDNGIEYRMGENRKKQEYVNVKYVDLRFLHWFV